MGSAKTLKLPLFWFFCSKFNFAKKVCKKLFKNPFFAKVLSENTKISLRFNFFLHKCPNNHHFMRIFSIFFSKIFTLFSYFFNKMKSLLFFSKSKKKIFSFLFKTRWSKKYTKILRNLRTMNKGLSNIESAAFYMVHGITINLMYMWLHFM